MEHFEAPSTLAKTGPDPWKFVAYAFIAVLAYLISNFINGSGATGNFPTVGFKKRSLSLIYAKIDFFINGRDIMRKALQKYSEPFYVYTPSDPFLVLPVKYMNDFKYSKTLNFSTFFNEVFYTKWPGFNANQVSVDTSILKDAVRTKLTQSLKPVTVDLCEQADVCVKQIYGSHADWTPLDIRTHITELVAVLSTRVFLGQRMTTSKEWIRIACDFTVNLVIASRCLRFMPVFLQPYVHWIIPHCYLTRRDQHRARVLINEEIQLRDEERLANIARGNKSFKVSDSLGWIKETAGDYPINLADVQLSLSFAAIHTTSDLTSKCLYHIAVDPALANAVRKEALDVITVHGLNKESLIRMKLLDSLMKETLRLYPTGLFSLPRYTVEDVTMHDGLVIPKGQIVGIPANGMRDPAIYDNPDSFDGWRFLKIAEKSTDVNHWQFSNSSNEHYGFGWGIHTCPGRFFASAEVKVSLIFLTMMYDFEVIDAQKWLTRPHGPVLYIGMDNPFHPKIQMQYRSRKAEIDLMDYVTRD